MKKSVRLVAGVMGICMLCGCADKKDDSAKSTRDSSLVSESESSASTKETSEETTSETTETTSQEATETTADASSETSEEKTETLTEATTEAPDGGATAEASKKAYEEFLANEREVDASYLKAHAGDISMVEIGKDLKDDLSCKELVSYMGAHPREGIKPDLKVSYSYLDCGQDGVPELLLRAEGFEMYDGQIVIKYIGDKLEIKGFYESWDRSQTVINSAGFFQNGGSGGASTHMCDFGYFDANADLHMTVSIWDQSADYKTMDPKLRAFDEFYKGNEGTGAVVEKVSPEGADPYYTYSFFGDDVDEKIYTEGEIYHVMEGTHLPYVPYPESEKKVDELMGAAAKADPVEWVDVK